MSDHYCPNCVELFKVHRPTNWILCWFLAFTFFIMVACMLGRPPTTLSIAMMMPFIGSLLCLFGCVIFHFTRCSRFLISVDSTGHLHLHRRNNPVLGAQLVLEVNAGALRRKCKLHWDNPHNWKVSANNEYFFFTDPVGGTFSVSYCEKPHHAATGYLSRNVQILSDTLCLMQQQTYVSVILRLALQQTQPSVEESPIAGSIPATQG